MILQLDHGYVTPPQVRARMVEVDPPMRIPFPLQAGRDGSAARPSRRERATHDLHPVHLLQLLPHRLLRRVEPEEDEHEYKGDGGEGNVEVEEPSPGWNAKERRGVSALFPRRASDRIYLQACSLSAPPMGGPRADAIAQVAPRYPRKIPRSLRGTRSATTISESERMPGSDGGRSEGRSG